jgi:hypothetical protein
MKVNNYFLFPILLFLSTTLTFSQTFEYLSPKNNSIFVSLSTDIILKSTENINISSLVQSEFIVKGSLSGNHTGVVKLSDDNKTIIFRPDIKFTPNEVVKVTVSPGIKTIYGNEFSKISFQFHTTPLSKPIDDDTLLYNTLMAKDEQNYSLTKNISLSGISATDLYH